MIGNSTETLSIAPDPRGHTKCPALDTWALNMIRSNCDPGISTSQGALSHDPRSLPAVGNTVFLKIRDDMYDVVLALDKEAAEFAVLKKEGKP